jgi:DNA invertase Pin-like site-specific DNA recombinase
VQAKSTGFIAYYRVSTDRQGRSGLGLEAQRAAVGRYLAGIGGILKAEHTEVETGRRNDRPELQKALAACRKHKARLVIAKLDRLSRNVAFIATMMDAGVEFVACDNPHATRLTLHILAAVAEHEREMISARTKAALQAAKARGVRLGRNAERLAPANRAAALDHANQIKGVLAELNRSGMTNREIAAELTARGITTPRGGRWHPQTVRRVMERVALFSAQSTATINIIESRSLRNPEK